MKFEYERLQTEQYFSYESESSKARAGQERFIRLTFTGMSCDLSILDLGCGDGIGLRCFREMGFENVIGIDLSFDKVEFAKQYGYKVMRHDIHSLLFCNERFDVVYSSHSLEHAQNPKLVLTEVSRVLKKDGLFILVLPFPDAGPLDAHCGKEILGTVVDDQGEKVIKFIESFEFVLEKKSFDNYRETEIWLVLRRRG